MLEEMDVSYSKLYDTPNLSHMSYKKLNLSNNRIRVLWIESLPNNLEELDIHSNRLLDDGLLLIWPDTIHTLNLSYNLFTSLTSILHWPIHLKILNLSCSMLDGALPALPDSIEMLNISNSYITGIYNLPRNLIKLDASMTLISSLPYRMPENIVHINLAESKLKNAGLPKFWGSRLQILNLRYNKLKQIPSNLPETLLNLNVSNNFIQEISKPIPNSVECLNISNNHLFVIPPWLLQRQTLKSILHYNYLTYVPIGDNIIASFGQWVAEKHIQAAQIIARNWRRLRLRRRLRAFYKNNHLKFPLLEYVFHPERVERFGGADYISQVFY